MRRTSRAGSIGLLLALAVPATAGDDLPPPLTLPSEAPAPADLVTPPGLLPGRDPLRPKTNLLRPRPTIPGAAGASKPAGLVTSPSTGPLSLPAPGLSLSASPDSSGLPDAPPPLDAPAPLGEAPPLLDGPPPLDGPSASRVTPGRRVLASPRRLPTPPEGRLADTPPPLLLEPAPEGDLGPLPDLTPEAPRPEVDRIEPEPRDDPPPAPPRRRLGIFPLAAPSLRPRPGRNPSIRVEPRSDPAADAALKRRIEAKVKAAVGDRARDIEVRVVDRNVVVRARVDRFWNRRGVRRTIESLPALAGYKAWVEIEN